MRIKYLLVLLAAALYLGACNKGENKFTVVGDIENMPEQKVVLEELGMNEFVVIDSSSSDAKGHFELSGNAPESGLYRVTFTESKFILLSIDKGTVKVKSEWNSLENYTVNGSPSSESLRKFIVTFRGFVNDLNTMNIVLDTMAARGNDSMLRIAQGDMENQKVKLTRFIEQYADTTAYAPNAVFAAQVLNPAAEKDYLTAFTGGLAKRFPKSKLAKDFIARFNQAMGQTQVQEETSAGPAIGTMAPDVTLTSTDGKEVSISSFKGKYVLVDFWASWCGPCRRENPNVVKAYNNFKNKNFTILGISLDDDRSKWMQAIEKDALTWTHISDLKGWESIAARTYGVQSIPANFLLDPDGKIIARDLRAEDLQAKLAEVLK